MGWGDYYYALGCSDKAAAGEVETSKVKIEIMNLLFKSLNYNYLIKGSQWQGRVILLHRRLLQLKWGDGGPHGTDRHGCPGQLDEIMTNDKPTFLPQTTTTLFAI